MGRQVVLALVLAVQACVAEPDCDDADYASFGICVIEPPMAQGCFESLARQIHAGFGVDLEWYADRDYAVTWRPAYLDEEDAATLKVGNRLWTEIRPGLVEYRIAQVLVHEFLHMVDYRLNGKFDVDPKTMHSTPGYFRVAGPNSLESRVYEGLDISCL